jgi:hypothetical protein
MGESLTLAQLQTRLAEMQSALRSVKSTGGKRRLEDRIRETALAISEITTAQSRAVAEEQHQKDDAACKAAEAEIWGPVRAQLVKGQLELKSREAARQRYLQAAEHAEEQMKKTKGQFTESGAELSKVWKAKCDAFKGVAQRLEIFDYDLEHEALDLPKEYFGTGFSVSAENFTFRTLTEKALLVHATRRFLSLNNRTDIVLPEGIPNPILIPRKPPVPLAHIMKADSAQMLAAVQANEQPLDRIYKVETSTLENPTSPPLLLWPYGGKVRDTEVFWDFRLKVYRRFPEQAEQGDTVAYEQDLSGNWQPQKVFSTLAEPQPLTLIEGDRKPPVESGRTEFRLGHWWTKEDVEEAESAPL